MLREGVSPDVYTFPILIEACPYLYILSLHQHAIVHGFVSDAYFSASLINMYAKFGDIYLAHQTFNQMAERNVVPWTALISCYSRMGDAYTAFALYNQMRRDGILPNWVSILQMLSGISRLPHLQCLHACIVQLSFDSEIMVSNSLMNTYGRCGEVEFAHYIFTTISSRDQVSWNSLINIYAQNGYIQASIELLQTRRLEDAKPDRQTFCSILSAVVDEGKVWSGKLVHAQIITSGLESDVYIATALVGMYLKFGETNAAFQLFGQVDSPDVIAWTALISGLVLNEQADKALFTFCQMLRCDMVPSSATIASALAACAKLGSFTVGACLHGFAMRRQIHLDIPAYNSLLSMYAKCGHLKQSRMCFDRMKYRDVISWNAVITGYSHNGDLREAFLLLKEMRTASERPDSFTVTSLLQACASLGVLHQGKWLHNFTLRNGLMSYVSVATALVDMYSRCGEIDTAKRCFDQVSSKDLILWSAMIAAYGSHGRADMGLKMYSDFLQTEAKPNQVILLTVLFACSHAGLISDGLNVAQSITANYGMAPTVEHYCCLIDLLCRAGRPVEAYTIIKENVAEPIIDLLGIIFSACVTTEYEELREAVARKISAVRPQNSANYMQLVNTYALMGRWESVGETWNQMKSLGLKKTPGWSFIELNRSITIFYSGHSSHPRHNEIIMTLKLLMHEMKK